MNEAPTSVSLIGSPSGSPPSSESGSIQTIGPPTKYKRRPSGEYNGYPAFTSRCVNCLGSSPESERDQICWPLKLSTTNAILRLSADQVGPTCAPAGLPACVICFGAPPCAGTIQIVEEPTLPDPK